MHAAVEHVAQQIDHVGAHAGASGCERIRAKEQDGPHDIFGKRGADAHGVTSYKIALQSAQILVRDANRREIAEAGIHAVHRVVAFGDLGDDLRGLLDLTLRGAIEADGDVTACDREDVGDREVVSGEAEGRYFRFSRYQRPSSV
jgi:hypothetical protein